MEGNWKSISQLHAPFNDAVNYRTRQEKEFFNKIFLRTDSLSNCLKPSIYYLIGEKGAGKTAYAAYLDNNELEETRCKLSTMTESQYKRFIAMKKAGKLEYSDYANIWRPMLLNMMSQALVSKSKGLLESFTGKFDVIEEEIESFNTNSMNPEVEVAFEMVSEEGYSAEIGNKNFGSLSAKDSTKETDKSAKLQHHLLRTENRLKIAISDLRLRKNHVMFVDGIDYRPEGIGYKDYLACVKGLGEAVWQLNVDYFSRIRDSRGRLKIVLLVRPDVFHALNLYNSNSRLQDNSVFLDWATNETGMRESRLYEALGKYFSSQQLWEASAGLSADHYLSKNENSQIFRRLLRTTFHKPRDVLTFVKIARKIYIETLGKGASTKFDSDIIKNPKFTNEFSDYLLGEVRNYSAFYMEQEDFFLFLKFFQYLNGKSEFSFDDFRIAFLAFKNWIKGEEVVAKEYLRDPEALLQFFYDVNIIGYREEVGADHEKFYHYSFRERSLNNLAPKIKSSGNFFVNPGVAKALDIGLRAHTDLEKTQTPDQSRRRKAGNSKFRKLQPNKSSTKPPAKPPTKAPTKPQGGQLKTKPR